MAGMKNKNRVAKICFVLIILYISDFYFANALVSFIRKQVNPVECKKVIVSFALFYNERKGINAFIDIYFVESDIFIIPFFREQG